MSGFLLSAPQARSPPHTLSPALRGRQTGGKESPSEGQMEQSESPRPSRGPPPPSSAGHTGQLPTGLAATLGGGSNGPSVTECGPPDPRAQNRWQVSVPMGENGPAIFLKVTSVALTSQNKANRIMGSAGTQSPRGGRHSGPVGGGACAQGAYMGEGVHAPLLREGWCPRPMRGCQAPAACGQVPAVPMSPRTKHTPTRGRRRRLCSIESSVCPSTCSN